MLPFVGQAFRFLFRIVSDEDLGAIRCSLHVLRRNQEGLAHVVEESLSFVNVSRTRVLENRQTLNLLVSDVGTIGDQVANVTQMMDNGILQLESLLPISLQLYALVEEIKQSLQKALIYVEHLQSLLNMLSKGQLSPNVITPLKLRDFLLEIQTRDMRRFDCQGKRIFGTFTNCSHATR